MAFNHTLSAVLRGKWLIDKQWANDHLPMIALMLNNANPISSQPKIFKKGIQNSEMGNGYEEISLPYVVDPVTLQETPLYVWKEWVGYVPNPNIPSGSVAVIPVCGPITKYDGECGEAGSIHLAKWIAEIDRRENIGSMIFSVDTPGGEARAADAFVSQILATKKPTATYIHGMCASLGVFLSSATDEVHFSNEMNELGSIGSYCTLFDFTQYFELQGIKVKEIYAPQSVDKNKPYRDAIAGDTKLIEDDLKLNVDKFIQFVKDNRGDKAASNVAEWGTGKMFYAKDAIRLGLADSISPFAKVVSKMSWLSKRKK